MILYYLTYILRCVLVGIAIGYFMVKGTEYLVNKEYAKGTGHTLLAYIIVGLELFILFPDNNNAIIVFSIIFVSINLFGYVVIRNRIKGAR